MSDTEPFGIFWISLVVVIIVANTAWAINDVKRGSARTSFFGERVERVEEPFEFWIAVGSKLIVIPVGSFMLWFASSMVGG